MLAVELVPVPLLVDIWYGAELVDDCLGKLKVSFKLITYLDIFGVDIIGN